MRFLKTKTTIIILAGFALMAGPVAFASPITPPGTIEQLAISTSTGSYAELDVDAIGFVTCLDNTAGADCGTLSFLPFIAPHTDLQVQTKPLANFGGFLVSVTGRGGAAATAPTLQNLSDTNNLTSLVGGPASFTTLFTDTDYCGDPGGTTGGCFGGKFVLQMTNNPDAIKIPTASTTFAAFVSAGATIPAGTLINAPAGTTVNGCCGTTVTAMNPIASTSGSLSSEAVTSFPAAGSVLTKFNIGTMGSVPEPSSFALFGIASGFVALKLRRRKL